MKKIPLILLSMALAPIASHAQTAKFEGFAIDVGAAVSKYSTKSFSVGDGSYQTLHSTFFPDTARTKATGSIDLSYSVAVQPRWLLGIGANYVLNKTSIDGKVDPAVSNLDPTFNYQYQLKNNFGVYVKPTFVVSENLAVYGKIGYRAANIGMHTYDSTSGSADYSSSADGTEFALGVMRMFDKNLYLKMEAGLVNLKTKNELYRWNHADAYGLKLQSTSALVAVGYKF